MVFDTLFQRETYTVDGMGENCMKGGDYIYRWRWGQIRLKIKNIFLFFQFLVFFSFLFILFCLLGFHS
jgi:hypothetical protein